MKKLLSLALAAALACSLALPAAAAQESSDQRLTQVTQKVKQTLSISDSYTSFYGELTQDSINPYWRLSWEGEEASLTVYAGEDGKIYRYQYSPADTADQSGSFDPSFPNLSVDQARQAAESFVNSVLTRGESGWFDQDNTAQQADVSQYYFSGTVQLNGLDSPIGFSVTVRAQDGAILRFSRDDLYTRYQGGVPSAEAQATREQAADLLRDTLSLRLEYVASPDGSTASLQYLPNDRDQYYVDGQTGKLVNLTQLLEEIWEKGGDLGSNGSATDGAESAGGGNSLTQTELEGISKLKNVLDSQALDRAAKAWNQLGLSTYTLAATNYFIDRETDEVTAVLQYAKNTQDGIYRRYVTLDAKNGDLLTVSSSYPYVEEESAPALSAQTAQSKAEAFLQTLWGEDFSKTALYDQQQDGSGYFFHYVQQENGYFFPTNSLSITIDASDGSVSRLSRSFDANPTFDSPEGILSLEEALEAYFQTFQVDLCYLAVPVELDLSAPEAQPLIEMGYQYVYALNLSYQLTQDNLVTALDAKTGQPVTAQWETQASITYSDLEGNWGKNQAETLAGYGVGWLGGVCRPSDALTQLDLIALLASTQGYLYNPQEEDSADALYQYAYSTGLLTQDQRQDDALLTRGQLVKLLLDATGYGKIAGISSIFRCSFADEAQIPDAYYGYAAIAQGLGIVGGDSQSNFACDRTATRMEALVMLYNYMSL
jgi:hypothetical protein